MAAASFIASGCMFTNKSGVMLSGYRAEHIRLFESGDQLHVSFQADSTTWIPRLGGPKPRSLGANIGKAEFFAQENNKRFMLCPDGACFPPASDLKAIQRLGEVRRDEASACYEFQTSSERLTIYDNCSNPRRSGEFSVRALDQPPPKWAYPAKLVAHPIAFAIDVIVVVVYAASHTRWWP